jgi:hypothetical protein
MRQLRWGFPGVIQLDAEEPLDIQPNHHFWSAALFLVVGRRNQVLSGVVVIERPT